VKPSSAELIADGFMKVPEAAAFLGLGRSTLYEMMDRGELVYARFGTARRIPRRAVVELASANLCGGFALPSAN
jgi:excisionase family DNA binding protein